MNSLPLALKGLIFRARQNLIWAVPCLLLPLLFAGCGANQATFKPTTPVTSDSAPDTAAAPVFSPAAGTYTTAQTVTLSAATAGSTIYYTADGSVPTTASTRYTGAIPVKGSEVIAAVAVASGYADSGTAKAGYVIAPTAASGASGPAIPANAVAASGLQARDPWIFSHDLGTPGTSVGATSLLSTPSLSGNARQFVTSFTDAGGERYSLTYANDANAMNFVYDGWVWIAAGSTVANLELDSNQVAADGQTVIYGFQCSDYSKRWEYSAGAHWISSSRPCDLSNWKTNAWHHVQISYSRDGSGNVTYHSVWLDGNEQAIDATVASSAALGWQVGALQTQFQLDGLGASGGSTVYLDNLTIYRW
ncbi:MAG: chitobiase/beta-hexosaminidase C-terminal domain-containing protein [Terracidiphilus sp.]